jgi:hypothetical protein
MPAAESNIRVHDAVLQGYLIKRPVGRSGLADAVGRSVGKSRKRYIVLSSERIQWYETSTSEKAKGELVLSSTTCTHGGEEGDRCAGQAH